MKSKLSFKSVRFCCNYLNDTNKSCLKFNSIISEEKNWSLHTMEAFIFSKLSLAFFKMYWISNKQFIFKFLWERSIENILVLLNYSKKKYTNALIQI